MDSNHSIPFLNKKDKWRQLIPPIRSRNQKKIHTSVSSITFETIRSCLNPVVCESIATPSQRT